MAGRCKIIQISDLALRQGQFHLADINLQIPQGQYGILMGKTGCGKTSILEAVAGLRRIAAGRIVLGGGDATTMPPGERGLGYVPQDAALFRTMTVYHHLAFALDLRRWTRIAIDDRVRELATWLDLTDLLHRRPFGLSGGEMQRVALGRALSFRPNVLLLDEPLSSLDETTRAAMLNLLDRLRGEVTILHVTHHAGEAARLADVLYRLEGGRLIQEK